MSLLSSATLLKILVVLLITIILLQYMYTTVFVGRHIEPLFVVNPTHYVRFHYSPRHTHLISPQNMSLHHLSQITENWLPSESAINPHNVCPPVPPNLIGPLEPSLEAPSLDELERQVWPGMDQGGQWRPRECHAKDRVAIIVPFRDRAIHLSIFLKNMHPFLQRQQIDYGIFVIEQAGSSPFNRAMLMNVGFVEANATRSFDCFIFHDVDLLPQDDRNLYNCPDQPRHMSVAVDIFNYRLPYADIFGGVSALSRSHFELVNGFSNMFWGWGGEDDDMSGRLRAQGLHISRYPDNIARYTMLSHRKQKANPKRFENLYNGRKRVRTDGLNSLQFIRIDMRLTKLYTWILVELIKPS